VYIASEGKLNHRFEVAAETVPIPSDSAALARGRHLAEAVGKCVDCHRPNFGGGMFIDAPPFARLAAPNLTRGQGGVAASLSDADWVRAIRHGVLPGGRGAIIMPAEAYVHLSDADLGAVIAYVKSVPPVDASWPAPKFGPVGRTLMALGKLPFIPAAYIDHTRNGMTAPAPDTTAVYGKYLAQSGGCTSCHNPSLSGGPNPAGPPDSPPPMNLTPIGLAGWTEAMFFTVLREGKKPDGSAIDNNFMPWRSSGRMTDDEIHAVWRYLQSVPPKEFGQQ
jgi:mono/diheme cytochrome c family protein